jgi:Spy/CpxP family protein refolding chaperone
MKAFKIFAIVAVVAALSVASVVVIAGNPQSTPQRGSSNRWFGEFLDHEDMAEVIMGHLQEELELTDDQVAQIRPILQAHLEQRVNAFKERSGQMREDMQKAVQDHQVLFQETEQQLAGILTEEQMQELRQMVEEHWGRWQEMRSRGAQGDFPARGRFGETIKELNLTVEQKKDLFAIAMKYRDMHKDVREEMQGVRQQTANTMLNLLNNDEFNEEQVRQVYRDATSKFEEVVVSGAKMLTEMKAVLTPEQLKILQEKGTAFLENMPEDGMFGSRFGFREHRMGKYHPMLGFRFHSSDE